jgi:hypothetical protein
MWTYVGEGAFIPGIPPYDMQDAEFEAACENYERNNQVPPDQKGLLKRSPLYKHTKDAPAEAKEE